MSNYCWLESPVYSYSYICVIWIKVYYLCKMDPIEWTLKKVPSIGPILYSYIENYKYTWFKIIQPIKTVVYIDCTTCRKELLNVKVNIYTQTNPSFKYKLICKKCIWKKHLLRKGEKNIVTMRFVLKDTRQGHSSRNRNTELTSEQQIESYKPKFHC